MTVEFSMSRFIPLTQLCSSASFTKRRLRGFTQSLRDRKVKNINCKFEFRLNCKQRFTFHEGPVSENRFMSVDAA